jgi:hypothetical protein
VVSMRFCPVCEAAASALVREAEVFGQHFTEGRFSPQAPRLCHEHLPLVAALTAPRHLAAWLKIALELIRADPRAFEEDPCPLCEAALARLGNLHGAPSTGFECHQHGGAKPEYFDELLDLLGRIAAGEKMGFDLERQAFRTALVQYASLHGTRAYIPRVE